METTLRHYLRKKPSPSNTKGEPFGLLVAFEENGQIIYGWSLCHRNDPFDKYTAVQSALQRAIIPANCTPGALAFTERMPHDVKKAIPKFLERCKKYFKQVQSI